MALKQWCGKKCSECRGCELDKAIPCSPDCENLTEDGKMIIRGCLEAGCDDWLLEDILHEENEDITDEEILEKYGELVDYPYTDLPDGILTKTLNVSILCQAYYNSSIEVPDSLTLEEAIEYAKDHLPDIPRGHLEYVVDSDQLDEENCDFAE